MFERVYVISLANRPERLVAFQERLPKDWPFLQPVLYPGVDGRLATHPVWWNGGAGGWGCFRSHIRIFEDCLHDGVESVLICEDDATFSPDFTEKVNAFLKHLPDDWCMIFIGGQHIQQEQRLPRKINDWVYQPYNVNRCHCYAFRGRKTLESVYQFVMNFPEWRQPHHIDHRLGELHKQSPKGLYCPREWLSGQSSGLSDICFKDLELREFAGAEALCYPNVALEGIAILGSFGCGASTVTGVLSHLGIPIGTQLPQTKEKQGEEKEVQGEENTKASPKKIYSTFEDGILGNYCRHSFAEPWLDEIATAEDRINHLRHWAGIQSQNHSTTSRFFAGKHPILSLMGKELLEAWNDPLFISVDRPIAECCDVIAQTPWRWHPRAVKHAIEKQCHMRDRFFEEYSPRFLRISFKRFLFSPEKSIQEICDFVAHTPSPQQLDSTLSFVTEQKNGVDPCL